MRIAIDILTGKRIYVQQLWHAYQCKRFKYPFWVDRAALYHILRCGLIKPAGNFILPSALAVFDAKGTPRERAYLNIEQTSKPMALFDYFLYMRHFFCRPGRPFNFDQQSILHEHATKMNFESRIWITRKYIFCLFHNRYFVEKGSIGVSVPGYDFKLYNIEQTNAPEALYKQLCNIARNIIGSKVIPLRMQNRLYDYQRRNGFTQPLWVPARKIDDINATLRDGATGIQIYDAHRVGDHFYNICELEDPLAAFSAFCRHKVRNESTDICNRTYFSRQDAHKMRDFFDATGNHSHYWVRSEDLAEVGGVLFPGQEGRTLVCSKGEWYNLDQVQNKSTVIRTMNAKKKRSPEKGALAALDDILTA